jgi:hypothetical protein
VAKKLVNATGATDYNILQNNGPIAHQVVNHVSSPRTHNRPIDWVFDISPHQTL